MPIPDSRNQNSNRTCEARLREVLRSIGPAAVAVSGGVDSMTLAFVAHRELGTDAQMFHAVSPAVPPDATRRVREHAHNEGWNLRVLEAGEFEDTRYLANPVNRCYYCKTNLYGALVAATDKTVVSGTNCDDLGDYRPGLQAAQELEVRHPFVEAGISKADLRAIARNYGLHSLAELPAAPCLSSRVETGIPIDPRALSAVDRAEKLLRDTISPATVRCRVRRDAVVVEMDEPTLQGLDDTARAELGGGIQALFVPAGIERPIRFASYARGSAFVGDKSLSVQIT